MARLRNEIHGIPEGGEAVTPHDSTNLTYDSVIYIGGDGNAVVLTADLSVLTFVGLSAGDILPVKVRRVNSTSTTATNIVALY